MQTPTHNYEKNLPQKEDTLQKALAPQRSEGHPEPTAKREGDQRPKAHSSLFYIYAHVEKIRGKVYVGQTRTSVDARFREHCYQAQRGSKLLFHKAIRKYGASGWETKILATTNNWENACRLERGIRL